MNSFNQGGSALLKRCIEVEFHFGTATKVNIRMLERWWKKSDDLQPKGLASFPRGAVIYLFIFSTFLLLLDSDHFSCCSALVSLAAWLVFGSKIIWLQKKNNPLFHNETEC